MKDALLLKILKQALPYLRQHRGRVMVVKLGGEIAADPEALRSLAEDLALLVAVSIRVVVVHGGGPQASELSRRLGLQPLLVEGRRVTDADTLEVAKMVFGGRINTDILSALRRQGVRAVGLSGVDAGILRCRRRAPAALVDEATGERREVDFGYVGDVTGADTSLLSLLMENGYVPVLASLGADEDGTILNVNADTVAAALAKDLKASKLIVLSNVAGVLHDRNDPSTLVPVLSVQQVREAIAAGRIGGGMKPKLAAIVDALEHGVARGHVLSGLAHGSVLLELFTRAGCGTLVVGDDEAAEARADAESAREADEVLAAMERRAPPARRAGAVPAARGGPAGDEGRA